VSRSSKAPSSDELLGDGERDLRAPLLAAPPAAGSTGEAKRSAGTRSSAQSLAELELPGLLLGAESTGGPTGQVGRYGTAEASDELLGECDLRTLLPGRSQASGSTGGVDLGVVRAIETKPSLVLLEAGLTGDMDMAWEAKPSLALLAEGSMAMPLRL